MAYRIQLRRDTAANFAEGNPVLAQGEPALEIDTGLEKMGDGVTPYNDRPYRFVIPESLFKGTYLTLAALTAAHPAPAEGSEAHINEVGAVQVQKAIWDSEDGAWVIIGSVGMAGNHSDLNLNDGSNPHGTTAADLGLGNVNNTSDADKPVSTAQQTALDLKADRKPSLYNATITGTLTLDLATFDSYKGILTGNTTLAISNAPSATTHAPLTKYLELESTTTETLTIPVDWKRYGEFVNDGSLNALTLIARFYPTIGLVVSIFINQETV